MTGELWLETPCPHGFMVEGPCRDLRGRTTDSMMVCPGGSRRRVTVDRASVLTMVAAFRSGLLTRSDDEWVDAFIDAILVSDDESIFAALVVDE